MIRTKFLSWLLRNFYKDYSVSFQTEHSRKAGIETQKEHALIENCTIKGHSAGIFVHGMKDCFIRNCFIYGRGTTLQNPFQVDFSSFWQSIQKVKL